MVVGWWLLSERWKRVFELLVAVCAAAMETLWWRVWEERCLWMERIRCTSTTEMVLPMGPFAPLNITY
jgi:hypothetical protein